jgi:nucleotide-binding universal stress UspA family protein
MSMIAPPQERSLSGAPMTSTTVPVVHPTDFSDLSINAFAHALKISLAAQCKLYVVHVGKRQDGEGQDEQAWDAFPRVRVTLARWGLCDENELPPAVFKRLGVEVAKVEIAPQNPVHGLVRFLAGHPSGLMVLATHGREGLPRWIRPSIAEAMSRRSATQTLFIPPHGRGFVDQAIGELDLKRILVPVDHSPPPVAALSTLRQFCGALGVEPEIHILHIGAKAPHMPPAKPPTHRITIDRRSGNVVDGILQAAAELGANLICMATAGHDGILDAIRGSTTERVLRHAPCPVLAVPIA